MSVFDLSLRLLKKSHSYYLLLYLVKFNRLFIIVMDVLASEVGTRPPWGLLFADDLALCAESST